MFCFLLQNLFEFSRKGVSTFSITDVQEMDALVCTFSVFEMNEAGPLVLAWAVFLYLLLTLPGNDGNKELMVCGHDICEYIYHSNTCILHSWPFFSSLHPGDRSHWLCSSSLWCRILSLLSWDSSARHFEGLWCASFFLGSLSCYNAWVFVKTYWGLFKLCLCFIVSKLNMVSLNVYIHI